MTKKAKSVEKVEKAKKSSTTKTRRPTLEYSELLGAYQALKCEATIEDLAKELDRPLQSVYQRWNFMVKDYAKKGKMVKPLKRRSSSRSKVDLDAVAQKYANVFNVLEEKKEGAPAK